MPAHRGSHDPNQDAADAVKQRGMDATVDLGKEPGAQQGIAPEQEPSTPPPHHQGDNAAGERDNTRDDDDD
jgi:hypothetical protein